MRKFALSLVAAFCWLQAGAAELQWLTDIAKAQAQAKAESKRVILFFTGSDY